MTTQSRPANPLAPLLNRAVNGLATLIVLTFWFGVGLLATMFVSVLADDLLDAVFGFDVALRFCLWLAATAGPYDSLIDPLPFNFAVGLSGGAVAAMLKIRALMKAK